MSVPLKYIFGLPSKFITKLTWQIGHKPAMSEIIKNAFLCTHDYMRFGSSISDYFELGFYRMADGEKSAYMTRAPYRKMCRNFDPERRIWKYNSKATQYDHLKAYMGREQLISSGCSREEFAAFVERHPIFIFKPDQLDCGRGVELINSSDYKLDDLYSQVIEQPAVLDEIIKQHPEMERLCPGCVNTLRVITVKVGVDVSIIGIALRIGNGTNIVDNYSAGGIVCAINPKTGCVISEGEDHAGGKYQQHPFSHVTLPSFQVPNWQTVLTLVNTCATEYEMNIVGWDIAVREKDAVVVEANVMPMIQLIQIAGNGGKRSAFEEANRKRKALLNKDY